MEADVAPPAKTPWEVVKQSHQLAAADSPAPPSKQVLRCRSCHALAIELQQLLLEPLVLSIVKDSGGGKLCHLTVISAGIILSGQAWRLVCTAGLARVATCYLCAYS